MRIIHLGQDSTDGLEPSVATIGFFDGVHRGHRFLIGQVTDAAQRNSLRSMVITFDRHPRQVLQKDYQPQLLSTLESKLVLLSQTGVDTVVVVHFDLELAALSARQFMEQVLSRQLHVKRLVIGYDNRFGHDRTEGFSDYVDYGRELGIDVVQSEPYLLHGVKVSSSVVRSFIQEGEIEMANECLGYPYTVEGQVVDGVKEGRRLGFPTANLVPSSLSQLLPAAGVYAVKARTEGSMAMRPAMTNIGMRPTFGGHQQTVETNILDFEDNIYGQRLLLSFYARIRDERKFDNVEQLVQQLRKDREAVEHRFRTATPIQS